jgi:hypothetical protein
MSEEEIKAKALELYPYKMKENKKGTGRYDARLLQRKAYIRGYMDALAICDINPQLTNK